MAHIRMDVVPADSNKWWYQCDTEADIANLPDDAQGVLVLEPDEGKSQWRSKNTQGVWKEVGKA